MPLRTNPSRIREAKQCGLLNDLGAVLGSPGVQVPDGFLQGVSLHSQRVGSNLSGRVFLVPRDEAVLLQVLQLIGQHPGRNGAQVVLQLREALLPQGQQRPALRTH